MQVFNAMSLLWGFSLFLIAIVLARFPSKQTLFALAAELDLEPDWDLNRPDSDFMDGPRTKSDYPNDEKIAEAFMDPGEDRFAVWADIGDYESEDHENIPWKLQRYTLQFTRFIVWNCYPEVTPGTHFLDRNFRSRRWNEDFWRRSLRIAILRGARGGVHLVSRGPNGPRDSCEDWHRRQFPQLRAILAVKWIDLIDIDTLEVVKRYWQRENFDTESKDNPSGIDGGGGGGNIMNGGREGGNPVINNLVGAGNTLIGGGGVAAAVVESIPPAVWVGGTVGANLLSNVLKGSPSPDELTDVIDHPNLGEQWPANLPAGSIGKQAMVLPNDASNLFDISQGTAMRPRDLGSTCNRALGWEKFSEFRWNPPPGSTNGGPSNSEPLFQVGLGALVPPVGPLNKLFNPLAKGSGNLLTVNVVQTRLQPPAEAEAGTCHLDVTILDGSNKLIASQNGDIEDSLELRVETPNLPSSFLLSWTGLQDSSLIHFRYGRQSWDSTDSICQTGPYVDDKRTVSCTLTTGN